MRALDYLGVAIGLLVAAFGLTVALDESLAWAIADVLVGLGFVAMILGVLKLRDEDR